MPPETRWMLKAALLNLVAGMALWGTPVPATWAWWHAAAPAALHVVVVGWLTQTIFAVGHWLFPKSQARPPRGRVGQMLAGGALLNLGIGMRLLAEPMVLLHGPGGLASLALIAAAASLWLGVALLAAHLWTRVH